MKKTVLLDELLDVMEMNDMDIQWYFDTQKENILLVTDEYMEENLEREEIESDSNRFILLPSSYEIHEHNIMVTFSNKQPIEIQDKLLDTLYSKGAFRKFKDEILKMDIRDAWFTYKREQLIVIASEWANKHNLAIAIKE